MAQLPYYIYFRGDRIHFYIGSTNLISGNNNRIDHRAAILHHYFPRPSAVLIFMGTSAQKGPRNLISARVYNVISNTIYINQRLEARSNSPGGSARVPLHASIVLPRFDE